MIEEPAGQGGGSGQVVDAAATAVSDSNGDERSTRQRRLVRAFVELADTLVTRFDLEDYLPMLCDHAHDVLDVQAAGVMLEALEGDLRLTAASSVDSAALDLFEMQAHEGPCFDAYETGEQVVAIDLRRNGGRWREFTARALEAGFHAVYAFPLRLRDTRIGAMNVFRHEPGRFHDDDVLAAQALADVATIGILSQRQSEEAGLLSAQLQGALDSRVIIEQAKGILAHRHEITPDQAFQHIRTHARSHQRRVRSVAEAVVDGVLTGLPGRD